MINVQVLSHFFILFPEKENCWEGNKYSSWMVQGENRDPPEEYKPLSPESLQWNVAFPQSSRANLLRIWPTRTASSTASLLTSTAALTLLKAPTGHWDNDLVGLKVFGCQSVIEKPLVTLMII